METASSWYTAMRISKKVDFDRAFGAIVNAEKHEIVRDFAIKDGEE